MQANVNDEHRCKITQQNASKPNPTIHSKDISWSSGIYPQNASTLQYLQIDQYDIPLTNWRIKTIWPLIDAEKSFDKIQQPFMIKVSRYGKRGNLPQHNKVHIWQTHSLHHSQWWKAKHIPSKIRNKARNPLSPLLFNTVLEVLATEIRKEKEIKWIQIGKEEVKLSLFADDMILYIGNPKDPAKILLELINKSSSHRIQN